MPNRAGKWKQRLGAVAMIAISAALLAYVLSIIPGVRDALQVIDDGAYDAAYRLRVPEPQADSPVVCVEVDDQSLKQIDELMNYRWPWPREVWGRAIKTLADKGAKVVVVDLLFSERSVYESQDDDKNFADLLDAMPIPVVIAVAGKEGRFVPPITKPPILADAETSRGAVCREYLPITSRGDSMALATLKAAGLEPKLPTDQPFHLRYFGPHRFAKGESVIPAYQASRIALDGHLAPADQLKPALFKDKIVLIGAIAAGTHDLKASPTSSRYPGVEAHATAIVNLIRGQQVSVISRAWVLLIGLALAFMIAAGVIGFRSASLKIVSIVIVAITTVLLCAAMMQRTEMLWLSISQLLLTTILAAIGALVWTYRIEDARARFLLKALGQCISSDVAKELALDPSKLAIGGRKQEMTILFSDLEGFTALTEKIGERIEPVLNLYLGEMSQTALEQNGTIDKFIGDAIMAFWNAPLRQHDHARRACETALKIVQRERELSSQLAELGANRVVTRIGIHTGPVVVGFFGSGQRLSYTAIGDSVNLAARLEPCNKLYSTQILISQDTLRACGDGFVIRNIDRVRVYGRVEPVAIFELLGMTSTASEDLKWLAGHSKLAGEAYFGRDWNKCLALVDEILHRFPGDGPARVWRGRAATYLDHPPPAEWEGVCEAKTK